MIKSANKGFNDNLKTRLRILTLRPELLNLNNKLRKLALLKSGCRRRAVLVVQSLVKTLLSFEKLEIVASLFKYCLKYLLLI